MFDEVCNVFTEGKRITNDTVQPKFKTKIPICATASGQISFRFCKYFSTHASYELIYIKIISLMYVFGVE